MDFFSSIPLFRTMNSVQGKHFQRTSVTSEDKPSPRMRVKSHNIEILSAVKLPNDLAVAHQRRKGTLQVQPNQKQSRFSRSVSTGI